MTWHEYHEATKHSRESLHRSQHVLDWPNMPDPFRQYKGVPEVDLPADPPAPEIATLELLQGSFGHTSVADGPTFLSQLLFHTAAISASKRTPSTGYRYALRVNPSSGNLHPTEFHFVTRGLKQWRDGLYHYLPSSHMAERRAIGSFEMMLVQRPAPIIFALTSIVWREAWKYGDRAYRYCLHDVGHAWQSLALAARAMGCESFASGRFPDDKVAHSCRLNEDEWPMLIVGLYGAAIPSGEPEDSELVWFGGTPNRLSDQQTPYPLIRDMHIATKFYQSEPDGTRAVDPADAGSGDIKLPLPSGSVRTFGEVVRGRRSALDFEGGTKSISLAQLSAILASTTGSFSADFASGRFVQLYLYAHRVDGLQPGVYRYWGECAELEQIKSGDQRVAAAGLSLRQNLVGNACVAFSMIADFNHAIASHGDRGYRYVHFEAGAIGQRLYLAAEGLGLGATGIGAFFDDEVNRYLDLASPQKQVIYHFAIGFPIPDPRLEA